MKKIKTGFIFLAVILFSCALYSNSITLSSDSDTVSVDETFRFTLSAEGSFDSIIEPQFNDFTVENRSESQSNSISIINGKMESKKVLTTHTSSERKKAAFLK